MRHESQHLSVFRLDVGLDDADTHILRLENNPPWNRLLQLRTTHTPIQPTTSKGFIYSEDLPLAFQLDRLLRLPVVRVAASTPEVDLEGEVFEIGEAGGAFSNLLNNRPEVAPTEETVVDV